MQGTEVRRAWWENVVIGAAAVTGGMAGWAVFAYLPPMQVLVGTERVQSWAPVWYQASVFPAFAAFMAAAGLDALAGRDRWWTRLAAGSILALLAGARLSDGIPISGHAACSAALIAEALLAPRREEKGWVIGLAAASLLITAWYKLMVWGDAKWFAVSLVVGVLVGGVAGRFGRRVGQGKGKG